MREGAHSRNTLDAVLAAYIAADLREVNQVAWETSLAAINSKIIAASAGESARGFQPINDFIGEVAREAMDIVANIGKQSIYVSRLASRRLILVGVHQHFRLAEVRGKESMYVDDIEKMNQRLSGNVDNIDMQMEEQIKKLHSELDELGRHMKASAAVVSVCRIEATRASHYAQTLANVADDLQKATEFIKLKVEEGLKTMALFNGDKVTGRVLH